MESNKSSETIIIIGAGASGIKCAYDLFKSGRYKISIFESADYIGGRMKHFQFQGRVFEEGANWISHIRYGKNSDLKPENPIWNLAKKAELTSFRGDYFGTVILNQDGKNISAEVNEQREIYYEIIDKVESKYANKIKQDDLGFFHNDVCVRDAFEQEGWPE